jgi:hypothetical protein
MNKRFILGSLKTGAQFILLLAVACLSLGPSNSRAASAAAAATDDCGQLVADAEARFLNSLPEDGSIPASPEVRAAAEEYIRVSMLCYKKMEKSLAANVQTDTPVFIDEGGLTPGNISSAQYVTTNTKWGPSTMGTSGGTVTYSFMPNGISFSSEGYGTSVAIASLSGFQACFYTDIQNAFAAWQTVSNIRFVQVTDSGSAFRASGATGDIRIAAHAFDGPYNVLAHAYFPPPSGYTFSDAGDMHFDSAEHWTCDTSGIDIGIVALHEIGHAIGLNHENTSTTAVMDPMYNPSLSGLQPDDINGITAVYGPAQLASPPPNDNFANAITIPGISFTHSIPDLSGATVEGTDPDNIGPCNDITNPPNLHLNHGTNSVWYTYTPSVNESISADTTGSLIWSPQNNRYIQLDTFIAVWTGSPGSFSLVTCNDDGYNVNTSQLSFLATAGTTYYFEVANFNCYEETTTDCVPAIGGNLVFNVNITNTDVSIASASQGQYYLSSGISFRRAYAGINNGPANVSSLIGNQVIASQRVVASGISYSEMMGYPNNRLTKTYWFPFYNNVDFDGQLRVSNVGGANTTITVYLGSSPTPLDSFPLGIGEAVRKNYGGKRDGPMRVVSSASNILTTLRSYIASSSSYSELMGYPANQLTDEYIFPYYNNVAFDSQLRVSNVGGSNTTITVYLGSNSTPIDSYTLGAGQATRKNYGAVQGGPLRVVSSASNILTTIRAYVQNQSYSELLGYPANQPASEFWYPIYDNVILDSQLRVSNIGTGPTTITVYFGNDPTPLDSFTLGAGAASRTNYGGKSGGPLHVVSSAEPILTTIRLYKVTGGISSYYELTGLPDSQLTTLYWFPWYNNVNLNTEMRFAAP